MTQHKKTIARERHAIFIPKKKQNNDLLIGVLTLLGLAAAGIAMATKKKGRQ